MALGNDSVPSEARGDDNVVTIARLGCSLSLHDDAARRARDPSERPGEFAAETLLDLGGVVPLSKVREALDRGIAAKVLTPMDAMAELSRRGHTGVRGTADLRSLLNHAGITGSHHPSVLEAKTRRLIDEAGLPQPHCEFIAGANGEYRLDFVWPELMLVIEVDGWMYHSSFEAFHGDKTRKNALTIEGFAFLNYTWTHVTKTRSAVVREMRAAYAARSASLLGA